MNPLALTVRLQEALPPPPEPSGSPEIDTVRVVGVVLVSLAIIVLLAIAIRPFIVKPHSSRSTGEPDHPTPPENVPDLGSPTYRGSIIPFPTPQPGDGPDSGPRASDSGSVVAERFNRVVGDPHRRRKLGDRLPTQLSRELSAALHRTVADEQPAPDHGGVVPLALPRRRQDENLATWPRAARPLPFEPVTPPEPPAPMTAPVKPASGPASELQTQGEGGGGLNAALIGAEAPGKAAELAGADPMNVDAAPALQPGRNAKVAGADNDAVTDAPIGATPGIKGEPAEAVETSDQIDEPTLAALHKVVRDLIHSANAGELLHGFALYSDPFLFRFMDGSGMSEEEFREFYGSIGPRPVDQWDHLDQLSDVVRLPDGRIEATATYVDESGRPSNGIERYRFVEMDGDWFIDDIAPVE